MANWRTFLTPLDEDGERQQRLVMIEVARSRVDMTRERLQIARRRLDETRFRIRRVDEMIRHG